MITRSVLLVLVLLSMITLTACDTGKNERAGQIREYEYQLDAANRIIEREYGCFFQTLETKKYKSCGVAEADGSTEPPVLSGAEYIQALDKQAKGYTSAIADYRIVADEYYAFLNNNEDLLIKDGVNVAQKKIALQKEKAAYEADKEKITAALNALMEQEKAQQEAIQNIIKLLIAIA